MRCPAPLAEFRRGFQGSAAVGAGTSEGNAAVFAKLGVRFILVRAVGTFHGSQPSNYSSELRLQIGSNGK